MGLYDDESIQAAMSVLCHETIDDQGDLFEQACLTTVVIHGMPPDDRFCFGGQNVASAYVSWRHGVRALASERFGVKPERLNDFITAYEMWCAQRKEEAQTNEKTHVQNWTNDVRNLAYYREGDRKWLTE